MPTNFPTSLDTITNPTSTDTLNSPSHSAQHITENDAIEALEAKVGINSSADATSLDYKLKNASSSNPGHKHTLAQGATDVTASAAELNHSVGVTSAIQTQLNAKEATIATLTVGKGGTGATSLDDHFVLIGSGTSAITPITPSDAGKVLTSNGVGVDPSFQTLAAGVYSLGVVPAVSLVSSDTETDLLSITIPAGTLGTGNIVRFKIPIWKIKKAGGSSSILRLKYDDTTLISIGPDNNGVTYTDDLGFIEGYICGNGATNSQRGWLFIKHGQSNIANTTVTSFESMGTGTSAEDSTGALVLKVVWRNNVNSANDYIYTMPGTIEKIV